MGEEEMLLLQVLRHKHRLSESDPDVHAQTQPQHRAELKSLLTLRFQTFKEVPVIGEEGKVSLFSGANQSQKKVSSRAA
jgi:hypothetical protein